MERYYREGQLADTSIHRTIGIAPYGFFYTENLAEWIDRLAAQEPPEPEPEPEAPADDEGDDAETDEGDDADDEGRGRAHSNIGESEGRIFEKFEERLKKMTPDKMYGGKPAWE